MLTSMKVRFEFEIDQTNASI